MAPTRILLGIICFAVTGSSRMFNRNLLKQQETHITRKKIILIASKEVGVREKTGFNDGIKVESYLKLTGLQKGHPWCAAFVSWVYAQNGLSEPRSAWSPTLFPSSRLTTKPLPGDLLGIYFPAIKRIAHVGIIERIHRDWVYSIEGNTNNLAGREGDGVYRKMRHIKSIRKFSNWIKGDAQ
jgi:hypothetical protein